MTLRLAHDLMPYLRLADLVLVGGTLVIGMLRSLPELLPSGRARLAFGVAALLLAAISVTLRFL